MKTLNQFIAEGALRPSELIKPNSKTGEARLDILAQKIKNDDLLELTTDYARRVNATQFKVTDKEAALEAIKQFDGKPIPLTGTINGKPAEITTSNLEKTNDFGEAQVELVQVLPTLPSLKRLNVCISLQLLMVSRSIICRTLLRPQAARTVKSRKTSLMYGSSLSRSHDGRTRRLLLLTYSSGRVR